MSSPSLRVGFIGLGFMGLPMTLRLLDAGHSLHVFGRDPNKFKRALDAGAQLEASPAAVAAAVDICAICVTDTNAVDDVVFGKSGVAAGFGHGKVLVDHSSIKPSATHDFCRQLKDQAGAHWVDAPVSGGPPSAAKGTLAIMAGADDDVFATLVDYFLPLGRAVHTGAVGSGQTTKLINQLIVGCTMSIVAESTNLALKAGLAPDRVMDALSGGRADSPILQTYMTKMAEENVDADSYIHTILKDMNTVHELARGVSARTPMLSMAREIHKVVSDRGFNEADVSRVIEYYK